MRSIDAGAERIPERRAQVVEGSDLLPGEGLGQPVAQGAAEGKAREIELDGAGVLHPCTE